VGRLRSRVAGAEENAGMAFQVAEVSLELVTSQQPLFAEDPEGEQVLGGTAE